MTVKQRMVEAVYNIITLPDPQIGWLHYATKQVKQLLKEGSFDAVISTSYPYTCHLIARLALRAKDTFWVADMRDAWRGNHYVSPFGIRAMLNAMLEPIVLRRANAITTVSEPLRQKIYSHNRGIPTFTILNSFDPEDWLSIPFTRPRKFTLTYAGSLLQGFRDPEPLFKALLIVFNRSIFTRRDVEIIFYARDEPWLRRLVAEYGLKDIVQLRGLVERNEVLKAERGTTANIVFLRDHPDEEGVYTGKIFEYIGAGLPIVAIGGPEKSVIRDLLGIVGGWYARTPDEVAKALQEIKEREVAWPEISQPFLEGFSAITMAKHFAQILNQCVRTGPQCAPSPLVTGAGN